jgi:hypothetical protein
MHLFFLLHKAGEVGTLDFNWLIGSVIKVDSEVEEVALSKIARWWVFEVGA